MLSWTVIPPPGQHVQRSTSESRVIMKSIGVTTAFGKASDPGVSPNTSAMTSYANQILLNSALPPITKFYSPNEMVGLLHDLQSRLGI